jgi:hypothetical protein
MHRIIWQISTHQPPNKALSERLGLGAFFGFFLSVGSFPFPVTRAVELGHHTTLIDSKK